MKYIILRALVSSEWNTKVLVEMDHFQRGERQVATMHPDQPPMAFVDALKRYAQAKGLPTDMVVILGICFETIP